MIIAPSTHWDRLQGSTLIRLSSASGYLWDQNGKPWFINGDTNWSLISNATRAEATQYLEDRAAKGYNAVVVNLIDTTFCENAPNNVFDDPPFTTPNDFSTPGAAYWAHVDWVMNEAYRLGIVLFAHPFYMGTGSEGWKSALAAESEADCTGYGVFLGTRYLNQPNLVWVCGGDSDPVTDGHETNYMAVVNGIKSVDTLHVMTAHNLQESAIDQAWADDSWIGINTIYTYSDSHAVTLSEYNADTRPIYFQESHYEREGQSDLTIRSQAWWSVLSGARLGHFFGNCPLWGMDNVLAYCAGGTPWTSQLNSTLSNDLSYLGPLFTSRAFILLVPDQDSSVMTAGVESGSTKAATSRASDGSTIIAYIPTQRQVTVDCSQVGGSLAHVWWFNPRTAATQDDGTVARSSQNFTPPDTNDWVLVIDNDDLGLGAPGTEDYYA